MKKTTAAGAALGVLVLAYAGASWHFANQIQARYEAEVAHAQSLLGTRAKLSHTYERGLLTSQARLTLEWVPPAAAGDAAPDAPPQPPAAAAQPIMMVVDSRIRQGPLAGLRPAAAVIESRFSFSGLDDSTQKMLSKAATPTLTSVYGLTGAQAFDFLLPAGEVSEGATSMQWQALTVHMEVNAGASQAKGRMSWPEMGLRGVMEPRQDEDFALGMSDDADDADDADAAGADENPDNAPGDEALPNAAPAPTHFSVALKGMKGDFELQLQDGLWLLAPGTGSAQADSLNVTRTQASALPEVLADLQGLTYTADITRTGETMSWTTKMQSRGDLGPIRLEALGYTEAVRNIDLQALQLLQNELRRSFASGSTDGPLANESETDALWKAAGPRFVAALPAYDVKLSATLEGQEGTLEYGAQVRKAPNPELVRAVGMGPALLGVTALSAKLRLPSSWLPRISAAVTGEAVPIDQIDGLMQLALAQGWLVKEGDVLVGSVHFEEGRLQVNGKAMAFPALGGGL